MKRKQTGITEGTNSAQIKSFVSSFYSVSITSGTYVWTFYVSYLLDFERLIQIRKINVQ
jgi:hypothetical protein